ncbi:MAG: MBL fold metallo-hydrolase [Deltaproteobacteria bacterium]|nr:MBL fold metallo-hydrolase [Deltaproteobacteria bacterium]
MGTLPVDAGGFARYRRTVTDATLVEACTLPGARRVLVNADDESTTLISPFAMRFFGIPVPQDLGLQVYSNGFISQMAIDPTMAIGGTIPDSRPPNGLIAPYWADLVTGPDGVCSVVVGSAPIRRWIIQWKNARFYTGETSMPVAGTASFEVIYNEADASMDFIYETITGQPSNAPTRAAVGLEHPDGTLAFVVCPGGRIDGTPRAPDCTSVTTGTRFRVVPCARLAPPGGRAQMFAIDMLPADHGDCLWIDYGPASAPRRILIDGGTPATFRALRPRIAALPPAQRRFELLVVSHIDADHIGGVIELLEDTSLGVTFGDIWFNGFRHLPTPEGTRGAAQGERLSELLRARRLPWNLAFRGDAVMVPAEGALPRVTLDGAMTLTLLSPHRAGLERLRGAWEKECRDAGIAPGVVRARDAAPPRPADAPAPASAPTWRSCSTSPSRRTAPRPTAAASRSSPSTTASAACSPATRTPAC